MDILKKTIDQMPDVFTSNQFRKQAIKNGYPVKLCKVGFSAYLKKYADNDIFKTRTWAKKPSTKIQKIDAGLNEEEMILYLKNKGYKIMKPVNEWVEC